MGRVVPTQRRLRPCDDVVDVPQDDAVQVQHEDGVKGGERKRVELSKGACVPRIGPTCRVRVRRFRKVHALLLK